MNEENYRLALKIAVKYLKPGFPNSLKPMSALMCEQLGDILERVLNGESVEKILNEFADK